MTTRDSKYDILRVLSMYMIICGHLICHGIRHILSDDIVDVGFAETFMGQVNFFLLQFLGYLCNIGSNLFIMITGFFLIQPRTIRYSIDKGFRLWGNIVFYSLLIYGIVIVAGLQHFDGNVFMRLLMPIHSNAYWFMTMYLGILLLAPFMAKLMHALSKKEKKSIRYY